MHKKVSSSRVRKLSFALMCNFCKLKFVRFCFYPAQLLFLGFPQI